MDLLIGFTTILIVIGCGAGMTRCRGRNGRASRRTGRMAG